MSQNVYVSLEVPIGFREHARPLEFHCWLPIRDEDEICVEQGDRTLRLSFQTSDPERDQSYANASIDRVFANLTMRNLSEELIRGIIDPPDFSIVDDLEARQNNVHMRLAEDVLKFVGERVGRLIAYVRNHRGQYLLEELPPLHHNASSTLLVLKARIKVGELPWKAWRPPGGVLGITAQGYRGDRRRIINQEDWAEIRKFVVSDRKVGLVRELLTGAEVLAEEKHGRAALTEAVTALEVAIHEFARSPSSRAFGSFVLKRIDVASLKPLVERKGLTFTVGYLLPLILSEDIVSTDLLRDCSEALNIRQNVVHNGQRTVDSGELDRAIEAIRELCLVLETIVHRTDDADTGDN